MAQQNGKQADEQTISIEDMPVAEGPAIPGTGEQLSFDLGSQYNLAFSTLKLSSIPSLAVDGQFQEGDRVRIELEVEVEFMSFPPIRDRGFRVGTERRHHAVVLSASALD